jgi:RNase P subunit RPR2
LGNGNSNIHARFRYLIDIKHVQSAVKSCELCSAYILLEASSLKQQNPSIKYEWRDGTCEKCSAWLYNLNHDKLKYQPEKEYPVSWQPTKIEW